MGSDAREVDGSEGDVKSSGSGGQELDGAEAAAASALVDPALSRSESVLIRTAQSDVVPASLESQLAARTAASRVLSVGPASHSVAPTFGLRREPGNDDVTTVDGAFEPLTREQREALARRIRSELEHTRPFGTPVPSAVQPAHPTPPHPFKHTMRLGVAQARSSWPPDAPASPPPASEPPSLRGSFVRVVGPPTSPPPRRPRRTEPPAPLPQSSEATNRAPDSEPEHEAFQLDRPSRVSMLAVSLPAERSPSTSGSSVMLPPPPQAGDYEVSSPSSFPPAVVRSELQESGTMPVPERRADPLGVSRPAPQAEFLGDIPSVDPFAGFVAAPPSFVERWLVVLIVALALVGAAALAAIAFGYLGRPG
jgi:hypothetical protein